MPKVTVKLSGFDGMGRDLKKLSGADFMDALEAGARVIQAHTQENIRTNLNKHPTGFLANSVDVKREGKTILVGVFGVVYAKVQEFGGLILARAKPFLAFQIDGKWIFTKKVVLPARPYLRPAIDSNLSAIKQAIIDAARGIMQGKLK